MAISRIHALITGRVQGVFFRDTTRQVANTLNLVGWVRNLRDGRVEVLAEGDAESLDAFIEYLKVGPSSALVENVILERDNPKGGFRDFQIVASAHEPLSRC